MRWAVGFLLGGVNGEAVQRTPGWARRCGLGPAQLASWQADEHACLCAWQVKDLASVSLKNPVRIFVNSNTDVAPFLRQEFIRIRPNREGDREAIVAGGRKPRAGLGRVGSSSPLASWGPHRSSRVSPWRLFHLVSPFIHSTTFTESLLPFFHRLTPLPPSSPLYVLLNSPRPRTCPSGPSFRPPPLPGLLQQPLGHAPSALVPW